jgi:hypothetical protein
VKEKEDINVTFMRPNNRIGRSRRSGCGGIIDNLSCSLITWMSVIIILSSCYINFLKHVHLRGACGSIPMVGMTCVSPLRRGRILRNQMLPLNWLAGILQKFSDNLMMR